MESSHFLAVSSPCGTPLYKTFFLDFWFRLPNPQIFLPKIFTKSPITRLVWQIDRRCLHLPGVFGDDRFNGTMQNVLGPTLVAMATKFRLGAKIQSYTGLSCIVVSIGTGCALCRKTSKSFLCHFLVIVWNYHVTCLHVLSIYNHKTINTDVLKILKWHSFTLYVWFVLRIIVQTSTSRCTCCTKADEYVVNRPVPCPARPSPRQQQSSTRRSSLTLIHARSRRWIWLDLINIAVYRGGDNDNKKQQQQTTRRRKKQQQQQQEQQRRRQRLQEKKEEEEDDDDNNKENKNKSKNNNNNNNEKRSSPTLIHASHWRTSASSWYWSTATASPGTSTSAGWSSARSTATSGGDRRPTSPTCGVSTPELAAVSVQPSAATTDRWRSGTGCLPHDYLSASIIRRRRWIFFDLMNTAVGRGGDNDHNNDNDNKEQQKKQTNKQQQQQQQLPCREKCYSHTWRKRVWRLEAQHEPECSWSKHLL